LKARYKTSKQPYIFKFGEDFPLAEDDQSAQLKQHPVDTEAVKSAVEEGFKGALDKLGKSSPQVASNSDREQSTNQVILVKQIYFKLFYSVK